MFLFTFLAVGLGVAFVSFVCTVSYFIGKDYGQKRGYFEGYISGHEIGFKTGWALDQKRRS